MDQEKPEVEIIRLENEIKELKKEITCENQLSQDLKRKLLESEHARERDVRSAEQYRAISDELRSIIEYTIDKIR